MGSIVFHFCTPFKCFVSLRLVVTPFPAPSRSMYWAKPPVPCVPGYQESLCWSSLGTWVYYKVLFFTSSYLRFSSDRERGIAFPRVCRKVKFQKIIQKLFRSWGSKTQAEVWLQVAQVFYKKVLYLLLVFLLPRFTASAFRKAQLNSMRHFIFFKG